jgi:hypothetical protein
MFGRVGLDPVPLPWSWARQRLRLARNYWIATTRPDGRPHTRPVWGVWHQDAFYFSTGSLAAENLRHGSALTVHLESGAEVLILEGDARPLTNTALDRELVSAYNEKYGWDLDPDQDSGWYEVRPDRAFGWLADDTGADRGAAFHGTATRWRWPSRA